MVKSFYLHACSMSRIFDFYPIAQNPEFYVQLGTKMLKTLWKKRLKRCFSPKNFTILFFEDQILKMVKSF